MIGIHVQKEQERDVDISEMGVYVEITEEAGKEVWVQNLEFLKFSNEAW